MHGFLGGGWPGDRGNQTPGGPDHSRGQFRVQEEVKKAWAEATSVERGGTAPLRDISQVTWTDRGGGKQGEAQDTEHRRRHKCGREDGRCWAETAHQA